MACLLVEEYNDYSDIPVCLFYRQPISYKTDVIRAHKVGDQAAPCRSETPYRATASPILSKITSIGTKSVVS